MQIIYYFYHHMNKDFPRDDVYKAVRSGDYDTFKAIYEEWHIKDGLLYLSSQIFVTDNEYNKCIYANVLDEFNFKMIEYAECECG